MIKSLQQRRYSKLNYPLLAIWVGLNVVDSISTYIVLQCGGLEVNPLASCATEHLQLVSIFITKILFAIPAGIFVLEWKPGLLVALSITMACVAMITTFSAAYIVINNGMF